MTTERLIPSSSPCPIRWSMLTPGGAPSALGVVGLFMPGGDARSNAQTTHEFERTLDRLGVGGLRVGEMALRRIAGVDGGMVVRWSSERVDLFPHGGPAVIRTILERLGELGIAEAHDPSPREVFPEARDDLEARMLEALARSASPRAVDLLLDQPRRWSGVDPQTVREDDLAPASLGHLIRPALVVAIGAPNIGKSSLANALAGRGAVLVADEAGTTRDHVGLTLELDGLVVRFLDTPGVDPDSEDRLTREATRGAMRVVRDADLVLCCHDASDPGGVIEAPDGVRSVRVGLRADRATGTQISNLPDSTIVTSSATGFGLERLAVGVRRALVPDEAVCDARPWRFWERA